MAAATALHTSAHPYPQQQGAGHGHHRTRHRGPLHTSHPAGQHAQHGEHEGLQVAGAAQGLVQHAVSSGAWEANSQRHPGGTPGTAAQAQAPFSTVGVCKEEKEEVMDGMRVVPTVYQGCFPGGLTTAQHLGLEPVPVPAGGQLGHADAEADDRGSNAVSRKRNKLTGSATFSGCLASAAGLGGGALGPGTGLGCGSHVPSHTIQKSNTLPSWPPHAKPAFSFGPAPAPAPTPAPAPHQQQHQQQQALGPHPPAPAHVAAQLHQPHQPVFDQHPAQPQPQPQHQHQHLHQHQQQHQQQQHHHHHHQQLQREPGQLPQAVHTAPRGSFMLAPPSTPPVPIAPKPAQGFNPVAFASGIKALEGTPLGKLLSATPDIVVDGIPRRIVKPPTAGGTPQAGLHAGGFFGSGARRTLAPHHTQQHPPPPQGAHTPFPHTGCTAPPTAAHPGAHHQLVHPVDMLQAGYTVGVPGSFVSSLQTASAASSQHHGSGIEASGSGSGSGGSRGSTPAHHWHAGGTLPPPQHGGAPPIHSHSWPAPHEPPFGAPEAHPWGQDMQGGHVEAWPGTEALRAQESRTGGNTGMRPGVATPERGCGADHVRCASVVPRVSVGAAGATRGGEEGPAVASGQGQGQQGVRGGQVQIPGVPSPIGSHTASAQVGKPGTPEAAMAGQFPVGAAQGHTSGAGGRDPQTTKEVVSARSLLPAPSTRQGSFMLPLSPDSSSHTAQAGAPCQPGAPGVSQPGTPGVLACPIPKPVPAPTLGVPQAPALPQGPSQQVALSLAPLPQAHPRHTFFSRLSAFQPIRPSAAHSPGLRLHSPGSRRPAKEAPLHTPHLEQQQQQQQQPHVQPHVQHNNLVGAASGAPGEQRPPMPIESPGVPETHQGGALATAGKELRASNESVVTFAHCTPEDWPSAPVAGAEVGVGAKAGRGHTEMEDSERRGHAGGSRESGPREFAFFPVCQGTPVVHHHAGSAPTPTAAAAAAAAAAALAAAGGGMGKEEAAAAVLEGSVAAAQAASAGLQPVGQQFTAGMCGVPQPGNAPAAGPTVAPAAPAPAPVPAPAPAGAFGGSRVSAFGRARRLMFGEGVGTSWLPDGVPEGVSPGVPGAAQAQGGHGSNGPAAHHKASTPSGTDGRVGTRGTPGDCAPGTGGTPGPAGVPQAAIEEDGEDVDLALGLNLMARSMSVSSTSSTTCPRKDPSWKDPSCSGARGLVGVPTGVPGLRVRPGVGRFRIADSMNEEKDNLESKPSAQEEDGGGVASPVCASGVPPAGDTAACASVTEGAAEVRGAVGVPQSARHGETSHASRVVFHGVKEPGFQAVGEGPFCVASVHSLLAECDQWAEVVIFCRPDGQVVWANQACAALAKALSGVQRGSSQSHEWVRDTLSAPPVAVVGALDIPLPPPAVLAASLQVCGDHTNGAPDSYGGRHGPGSPAQGLFLSAKGRRIDSMSRTVLGYLWSASRT